MKIVIFNLIRFFIIVIIGCFISAAIIFILEGINNEKG